MWLGGARSRKRLSCIFRQHDIKPALLKPPRQHVPVHIVVFYEQNTRLALETAARAYVLVTGELALSGRCAELREDPRIRGAYLGDDVST